MTRIRIPTDAPPTHPGEMLREEFLAPLAITLSDAAKQLGISRIRLSEIVNERRGMTSDTALRLERMFPGVDAQFWLNLQLRWDLYHALHGKSAKAIAHVKPHPAAVAARNAKRKSLPSSASNR